jgi:tRNA(fMet)-specific endonuclease VapC
MAGNKRILEDVLGFAANTAILPFGAAEARAAAAIRVALSNGGRAIGATDVLIAATALTNGCTLVTRNRREFDRVPGLEVEDWF